MKITVEFEPEELYKLPNQVHPDTNIGQIIHLLLGRIVEKGYERPTN